MANTRPLLSNKDATALYITALQIRLTNPNQAAEHYRRILQSNPTCSTEIPSKENSTYDIAVRARFALAFLVQIHSLAPKEYDIYDPVTNFKERTAYLASPTSTTRATLLWEYIFTKHKEHDCAPYALYEAAYLGLFLANKEEITQVVRILRHLRQKFPTHTTATLAQYQLGLLILSDKTTAQPEDFDKDTYNSTLNRDEQAAALFQQVLNHVQAKKDLLQANPNPLDTHSARYLALVETNANTQLNALRINKNITPETATINSSSTVTAAPLQATSSTTTGLAHSNSIAVDNCRKIIMDNKHLLNSNYFFAKLVLASTILKISPIHTDKTTLFINTDFYDGLLPTLSVFGQAAKLYREIITHAPRNQMNNNIIILAYASLIELINNKKTNAIKADFPTAPNETASRMPQSTAEQTAALIRLALAIEYYPDPRCNETETKEHFANMYLTLAKLFSDDQITILPTDYAEEDRKIISQLPETTQENKQYKKLAIRSALYHKVLTITPAHVEAQYQLALLIIQKDELIHHAAINAAEQAAQILRSILKANPNHLPPRFRLAELIIDRKINATEDDFIGFPDNEKQKLLSDTPEKQVAALHRLLSNKMIASKFILMKMIYNQEIAPISTDLSNQQNIPKNVYDYVGQLCREIIKTIKEHTTANINILAYKNECETILSQLLNNNEISPAVGDETLNISEYLKNIAKEKSRQQTSDQLTLAAKQLECAQRYSMEALNHPSPFPRNHPRPGTGTYFKPQPQLPNTRMNNTSAQLPTLPHHSVMLQRIAATSTAEQSLQAPPVVSASAALPPAAAQSTHTANKRPKLTQTALDSPMFARSNSPTENARLEYAGRAADRNAIAILTNIPTATIPIKLEHPSDEQGERNRAAPFPPTTQRGKK
jgi:hypothetical protein